MGQGIALFVLIVSYLHLQMRASVMLAEAWEDLRPVDACLPVDRRYAKFNTDLCASIGLLPCMSVALTTFQFRMGLISEAPAATRCFKLLSNFQSTFTCEYKHLKQFIFYEISTGHVYIDACTDACREIWQEYAYLFEAQDARR
ncbi:conserved hypothetical protein [Neospora caninum Liverpool]|uniref:Transmembrane protein n=1 Tax=Neospora caninum (strain Liverpool) TaxID=572307 RepID=F0VID1_NEOCL|nr:conserved hypothetical protein [Neospora caninum Liverpool]CBZ53492.1 conserved hypothetical protein [Neospora caninum Liverpool]CEL67480.1 TPA: hypothetical protein BN1204_032790 [Neospora caninum Liverpool]|eukprot:XP_003883524.1 conserved hypothetical protein [Neospora caninum Liverpool]